MNALHLTLAHYDSNSGVVKKIKAQAQAIKKCGFDKVFIGILDEDQGLYIDKKNLDTVKSVSDIKGQLQFFEKLENFVANNNVKYIYYRFNSQSEPFTILFFHRIKRLGIKCVMEIPTYPYDGEMKQKNRRTYVDKWTRGLLAKQFDYIVTFAEKSKIFGQRTIVISNAVDFSNVPLRNKLTHNAFSMVGVANLSYWHGFDRVISGIDNYIKKTGKRDVCFHIVSGKINSETETLKKMVSDLDLEDIVIFHGEVTGIDLDELFNISDVGIGSLGRHRNGIVSLKTLKNVEYAARGIPFIYSENNPDFDDRRYIIKASQDDSPIDIENLINWVKNIDVMPEQIRNTVNNLSWDTQMRSIIDKL